MVDNKHIFLSRASHGIYLLAKVKKCKFAVPINICLDVVEAIILGGSSIKLIDVDENLMPDYSQVDKSCKVVLIGNIYGISEDIPNFNHDPLIIDDACQMVVGADLDHGYRGDVGLFSFRPGKVIDDGCGVMWLKDLYLKKEIEHILKKTLSINALGTENDLKEIASHRKSIIRDFRLSHDNAEFLRLSINIKNILLNLPSEEKIDRSRKALMTNGSKLQNWRIERSAALTKLAKDLGLSSPKRFETATWRFPFYLSFKKVAKNNEFFLKSIRSGVFLSSWYFPCNWWFNSEIEKNFKYELIWKSLFQIPLSNDFNINKLCEYLESCNRIYHELKQ